MCGKLHNYSFKVFPINPAHRRLTKLIVVSA
uniref:Uncharacterized protein n=1 Tax=Podoviridae sp. ct53O25 TaxID=2826539 RepID=A0A8S5MBX6_9CAUD|nr:MAG TPA: hypothetical protein [Podoviridae sp. ct53O25]